MSRCKQQDKSHYENIVLDNEQHGLLKWGLGGFGLLG